MSRYRDDVDERVLVEGLVVAGTDLAMLVRLGDGPEYWIPRSLVLSGDADAEALDDVEIEIPGWFAAQEGID
jgi:hypothetical protein